MAREFANMSPIENVWNIMKKEIGNQKLCKKKDMWKRVCEAWYSVAQNILEELYNSIPRRIAALDKENGAQRNTDFMMQAYKNVVEFSLECT